MGNSFHYVLTFRDGADVLTEFDVPYLEFRLEKIVKRIKDADVSIVPSRKYRISRYKGTMDFSYSDVCFYSDGKGDVHYDSLPLDKAGRRVIE